MIADPKTLPDNVSSLKEIIIRQNRLLLEKIKVLGEKEQFIKVLEDKEELVKALAEKDQIIKTKELQIAELQKIIHGHRTEKRSAEDIRQGLLFNEVEETASKPLPARTKVKSHTRKKKGRKPIPDHLPVKKITHDLPEDKKVCSCGNKLTRIGADSSKELHIIPAKVEVEEHITYKYVCRHCECSTEDSEKEQPTVITNKPKRILPGTIASPSLLSYIIVSKYKDALPLYRLEGIFKRLQVRISRTSMASWIINSYKKLFPLKEMMLQELNESPVVSMDETPVQVLNEPGRAAKSKSYMWCSRNYAENPIVIYHYSPSRGSTVIQELLPDFTGTLLSDGYEAYRSANVHGRFTNAGCHVHARRNFISAADAGSPEAQHIISLYASMFRVERHCKEKGRSPGEIHRMRQRVSKPVFEKIVEFCRNKVSSTFGAAPLGKAYNYILKFEKDLSVFLDDPDVPIDNNRMENDIRPFVIGRKNWLFSDSVAGAEASAFWYGLITTAVQNGHDVHAYLLYLLTHFPNADTHEAKQALLPHRLPPEKSKAES